MLFGGLVKRNREISFCSCDGGQEHGVLVKNCFTFVFPYNPNFTNLPQPAAPQTATDIVSHLLDNLFIEFLFHSKANIFCITPRRNKRDKIKKHQHVPWMENGKGGRSRGTKKPLLL
jgi:hypothetical protein